MAKITEEIDIVTEIEKAIQNAKEGERYVHISFKYKDMGEIKITVDLTTGSITVVDFQGNDITRILLS